MHSIEPLEPRTLLSSAALVKDINTGTLGSGAIPLASVGGTTFFTADDGAHGVELWKTDGTAAGTSLVDDITTGPGSSFSPYGTEGVAFAGKCFFGQSTSAGNTLWESDGTAAGTFQVQNLNSGQSGLAASRFVVAGNRLYFMAGYGQGQSPVLWMSDGTTSGTVPAGQVASRFYSISLGQVFAFDNQLYFFGSEGATTTESLYSYEGFGPGVGVVASGFPYPVSAPVVYNGKLYFTAGPTYGTDSLWTSDGTSGGTHQITSLNQMGALTATSSELYFSAQDSANTSEVALWKSDGTAAGTDQVLGGFNQIISGFGVLPNGSIVFSEQQGRTFGVYVSNGTPGGTQPLANIETNLDGPLEWVPAGNALLFTGFDANSLPQLYKTDGTVAGTGLVAVNPFGESNANYFVSSNGVAYFQADDGLHGAELWKSDGTSGGTQLVADVNTLPASSSPQQLTAINGKLYFDARDQHGNEPWVSDGTAAGTFMLAAPDPYGSTSQPPSDYVGAAGKVFFEALPANRLTLYETDGTTSGTYPVPLPSGVSLSSATTPYIAFNNELYFSAWDSVHGNELWRTDGTANGTVFVDDIRPGSGSSNPDHFSILNGKLLFEANDGTSEQVYVSDGSAAGTFALTHFGAEQFGILQYAAAVNGKLYLLPNTSSIGGGVQLWQTDGTSAGTYAVTNFEQSPSQARGITASGGQLYLLATVPSNQQSTEIFKSDGTSAGTTSVTSLPVGVSPADLTQIGGKLFFVAPPTLASSDLWLWVSDGTAAGTHSVSIHSSTLPNVDLLFNANGTLLFSGDDGAQGQELWTSDGTDAGTMLVQDINPGPSSSSPVSLALLGNALYLSANDGIHGQELMKIGLAPSISGTVFNDANYDGIQDTGEQGVPGVTVYLDLNHDGQFDSGDISTTTDARGNYSFQNLTPGTYTVREVLPSGDAMTSPMGYSSTIPLALTQDATGPSFGDVNEASVTMNLAYFMALSRDFGKPG
ncbi:MAG TPA: ELWxxDGT repeat protein, partial [Tepidisphaeraceae bacterium]|nr:ELWxxDGT repeat protein [Tepidisphaeraceae bacterium]